MSEMRLVHEIPIHILQEFITILRANLKFFGEGKVGEHYYLYKDENTATVIFDNEKISYVANFVKESESKEENWFFTDKISVRESMKTYIKKTED